MALTHRCTREPRWPPAALIIMSLVCLEPQPALCSPCAGNTLHARRHLVFRLLGEAKLSLSCTKVGGLQRREAALGLFHFVVFLSGFLIIILHLKAFFLEPFERIPRFLANVFIFKGTKTRKSYILIVVLFTSLSQLEPKSLLKL